MPRAGRTPEPEAGQRVVHALLADTLGDLDRAHVRGLRQDLRHGHRLGRVLLVVAEDLVVDLEAGGHLEGGLGVDLAGLDRGSNRDQLEHGAGLVGVGEGDRA